MPVIGQIVGDVGNLRLKRRHAREDTPVQFGTLSRMVDPVLDEPRAHLPGEVDSIIFGVFDFQFIDNTQRLKIVIESAVVVHDPVQRALSGVAERSMPEIVCK